QYCAQGRIGIPDNRTHRPPHRQAFSLGFPGTLCIDDPTRSTNSLSLAVLEGGTMARSAEGADAIGAIADLMLSGSLVGLGEDELLARYVAGRDARALEMIVGANAPMVLCVCRRLLPDRNDVEDAFQATFLILIRKAESIRRPGSLAAWLHGV